MADDDDNGRMLRGAELGSGTDGAGSMEHYDDDDDEEIEDDEDDEDRDESMGSSSSEVEMSQPSGDESAAAAWNCAACTYENARSSSICEMCGTAKVASAGPAAAATSSSWACSACTLLNPRDAQVCSVCSTPNPAQLNSHRGLSLASALGLFSDKSSRSDAPQLGISGEKLEALCAPGVSKTALVDALQSITHHLAMMDASADTDAGFGVGLLLGRPKSLRLKHDTKMTTVLCSILKQESPFALECRLLACQSLNYLVKLDERAADGKAAADWMHMYLDAMNEMASSPKEDKKLRQQLAEEALNGLDVVCSSHPLAFRALCDPPSLIAYLGFVQYADTLHLQVLLTSLAIVHKVCAKAKLPDKKKSTHGKHAPMLPLDAVVAAIAHALHHANPRVQVAAIKSLTTLYHRSLSLHKSLHLTISDDCLRQLLVIMVQQDDGHEASRAAVTLLTHLLDDAPALLATIISATVATDLLAQLTVVLKTSKSEAVVTSTLRFLSHVVRRVHARASAPLTDFMAAFVRASAIPAVNTLLRDGASLSGTDDLVVIAVEHASMEMVRFLVHKGAEISPAAIHAAALHRRCDVLSYFLQHGANPKLLDGNGRSVAEALAAAGDTEATNPCVKLLALYDSQKDEHSDDPPAWFARDWMVDDGVDESEASEREFDEEEEDDEEDDDDDDDERDEENEDMGRDEVIVHDESMDEQSGDDRGRSQSVDSIESAVPAELPDADVAAFTSKLLATLLELCPTIDNKAIAQTILGAVCAILNTSVELHFCQMTRLLEIIQGLLMELHQARDDAASVGPFVLALRLLHALTRHERTEWIVQMERQGILALVSTIASRQAPTYDATLAGLAQAWLDALYTWFTPTTTLSTTASDVLSQLDAACGRGSVADILRLLSVDNGVTTYEFTKSRVVPKLLALLQAAPVPWQPSIATLVHHLHQAIGLHEALPVVSYGLAKGKELYPLTRQLRCRLRLTPKCATYANMPPRSIHASPLTLFSSFERTVFRCATLTDPKWTVYAWNLVGQRIWRQIDGKWVECHVAGFDPVSGCHLISRGDEFTEEVLHEEPYRLVKKPLTVFANVSMNVDAFGNDPNLKRKAKDDDKTDARRSKRAKKRRGSVSEEEKRVDDEHDMDEEVEDDDESGDMQDDDDEDDDEEAGSALDVNMEQDAAVAQARGKRKRLMDILKLDQAATSMAGDRVWLRSSLSEVCVSAVVVKRLERHQLLVHAVFGTHGAPVPLTVDEAALVSYQPRARPGSAASKVNRMMGALESQFRQGGRPMMEQLRRLLTRSRGDEDASTSTPPPANKAKGKQRAAPTPPTLVRDGASWTCDAPPKVRCLLGYGEFSDKGHDEGIPTHPLQGLVLTMNQKSLLDSVRPIFTALFEAFARGERPTSLPLAPTNVHSTLTLGLDDFGAFVKAVKLGLLASEEGIWFSQYAAIEHARTCLTLHGFFDFVAHLCRDSRRCKLLSAYLESIGVSEASLAAPSASAPTTLMAFQPEDNLLHCLSRLKPSTMLSSNVAPWKCMYSLYCDFAVLWDDDAASTPVTAVPSTQPTSYRDVVAPKSQDMGTTQDGALHQALHLLAVLYKQYGTDANAEMWVNTRLSRKLRLQLHDVLSITSGSYPTWCDELTRQFKFLFPLELRSMLFRTTAFGCSRSLHWLRDHLEPSTESDEVLSISPLPKERAKVERSDILKSADAVMKVHGKRKAILDIVFVGERGYGSGVTAAFYSAAAQALQSNAPLPLWVRGDEDTSDNTIRHPNGLFPLPTVDVRGRNELLDRFRLIGRLAGKALLDDRLLPLPLAQHFLQLVLQEPIAMHDLPTIFLEPGRIVYSLYKAARALQTQAPGAVTIEGTPVSDWLEAVDLSFVDPCTQTELVANGTVLSVTTETLSAYVDSVLDIWLGRGIAGQVQAFRDGLNDVVATEKLRLLHAHEIQAALCGTVDVEWTEASLRQTIKLAHGYTATSAPIEYFIQTLVAMTTSQRRAFLLYATGCPNLPPGGVGLETLKPPFEVVRRVINDDEDVDRALPFARTCTNTLHLPAYSCQEVLSAQLEYAVLNSKGVIDRD